MKEITVTQENRQEGFDNYQTTDDHGMVNKRAVPQAVAKKIGLK